MSRLLRLPFALIAGSCVASVIVNGPVPAMSKSIVFAPPALFESLIARRSEPAGPDAVLSSAVLVTQKTCVDAVHGCGDGGDCATAGIAMDDSAATQPHLARMLIAVLPPLQPSNASLEIMLLY